MSKSTRTARQLQQQTQRQSQQQTNHHPDVPGEDPGTLTDEDTLSADGPDALDAVTLDERTYPSRARRDQQRTDGGEKPRLDGRSGLPGRGRAGAGRRRARTPARGQDAADYPHRQTHGAKPKACHPLGQACAIDPPLVQVGRIDRRVEAAEDTCLQF